MQASRVLGQAAIPHLGEAELPLHDAEGMFNLGAQAGELAVELALFLGPRPVLRVAVRRNDVWA